METDRRTNKRTDRLKEACMMSHNYINEWYTCTAMDHAYSTGGHTRTATEQQMTHKYSNGMHAQ